MEQLAMFDMAPVQLPDHQPGKRWGGRRSTNARAKCRAMLPTGCWRCGRLLTPDMPESAWHAGHLTDRAMGGSDQDVAPECAQCNTSAGGKLGASITNGQKVQTSDMVRERTLKWW